MRLDPTKAFPHPVLRPTIRDDDADYPGYDIQTISDVEAIHSLGLIKITVEFTVQQPDILALVEKGYAKYGCLIWCNSTLHRDLILSEDAKFQKEYHFGVLADIVELMPLIVAVRDIDNFASTSWNPEYEGRTFKIAAGNVLAQDETRQFPATQELLKPVTSVFDVVADKELDSGAFDVVFADRIKIRMNPNDARLFLTARMNRNHRGNILAGVQLPVVMQAVNQLVNMDPDERQFDEWSRAFEVALNRIDVDVEDVKDGRVTIVAVSQRLLDRPLRNMSFLIEE